MSLDHLPKKPATATTTLEESLHSYQGLMQDYKKLDIFKLFIENQTSTRISPKQ